MRRKVVAAWVMVGLLPGLLVGFTAGSSLAPRKAAHLKAPHLVSVKTPAGLKAALGKPHDKPFPGTQLNSQLTNVTCWDWQYPKASNLIVFACSK